MNTTSLLLGLQSLGEGIIFPFTIWVFPTLPQGHLSHFWGALVIEANIAWLCQFRMSTHKWCQPTTESVIWILKILLGQSFIHLFPLPLFSGITGVAEVVVKLLLWSEPLHVLNVHDKILRFALCNKSHPVFSSQLLVRTEGALLFPPKLHKVTLVAPSSMRDDLHSYLLPLMFQLFWILNVC
jgi:hypothetical protein